LRRPSRVSDKVNLLKETRYEKAAPLWENFPGTMWAYPFKLQGRDVKLNIAASYDYEIGVYKMSVMVFG
jgi:hypothetical protein